jgi:hypothetical protein
MTQLRFGFVRPQAVVPIGEVDHTWSAMEDELIEIWLRGYRLARGMPSPEGAPKAFWIEVAKPQ